MDVGPKGALTVYFNQALLVGGEGVTFEVTDPSGEPVVGHLAWVKADAASGDEDLEADVGLNTEGRYQGYRGLRFQPSPALLPGTTYQVLVKDVQNLAGLPIERHGSGVALRLELYDQRGDDHEYTNAGGAAVLCFQWPAGGAARDWPGRAGCAILAPSSRHARQEDTRC